MLRSRNSRSHRADDAISSDKNDAKKIRRGILTGGCRQIRQGSQKLASYFSQKKAKLRAFFRVQFLEDLVGWPAGPRGSPAIFLNARPT